MRLLGKNISFFNTGVLFFYILCIVTYSPTALSSSEDALLLPIIVPYIVLPSNVKTVFFFVFSIILFIYGLSLRGNRRKEKDLFLYFLFCRLIIGVFQVLIFTIMGKPISFGNYFLYLIEFIFYCSCILTIKQSDEPSFFFVMRIVVLVVAVETIVQSLFVILPSVGYTSLWYKVNMRIPGAGSNGIGVLILPLLIAELFSKNKNKYSWLLITVCSIAIVLTKSRWSMFLLFCAFLKYSNIVKRGWGAFFIGATLVFVLFFLISNNDIFTQILLGFSDEVTTGGTINKLTSGRESMMESAFGLFLENPLLGFGPFYEKSRAHNIVIDLLFQNGLIGFFFFFLALYSPLSKYWNLKKKHISNDSIQYIYIIIIVFVIQSLGEISYFTSIPCDVFFFTSVAMLNRNVSVKRYAKKCFNRRTI